MINKSIIILVIIIVLIICLCLLLYTKFNHKSNKVYAGLMTFYKSDNIELIATSNYLSSILYLKWFMEKQPKKRFKDVDVLGEYILNMIYPYNSKFDIGSGYSAKLYNKIPLNETNLKDCYEKTLKKLKEPIQRRNIYLIIEILKDDGLTYYLHNMKENVDKEKIRQWIKNYYNIISSYLNKIFRNEKFQDKIMIDNGKVIIYITIFTEFMLRLLILENVQIMDPPFDFFVGIGGFNVAIPLLIKYDSEEPYKVVARFGHENLIQHDAAKINRIAETYNSMNQIFKLDTRGDILVKVLFNYELNNIDDTRDFQQRLSEEYNINIDPYNVIPAYGRIIEYIKDGDLNHKLDDSYKSFLSNKNENDFSHPIIELSKFIDTNLYYMKQYAELAIRFIKTYHTAGYIYCDWKLQNVGVNQKDKVVIVDSDLLNIEKIIKKKQNIIQTHRTYPTFKYRCPITPDERITLVREIFYRQLGNKKQVLQETEFNELVDQIHNENKHEKIEYLIEYYKKYDNYIMFKDIILNILLIYFKIAMNMDSVFTNVDPFLVFCKHLRQEIKFDIEFSMKYNYLYLLGLYDILAKNNGEDRFSDENTINVFNEIAIFIDNLLKNIQELKKYTYPYNTSVNKKIIYESIRDLINYFYIIPVKYCFEKGETDHAYEIHENTYDEYTRKSDVDIDINNGNNIEPLID